MPRDGQGVSLLIQLKAIGEAGVRARWLCILPNTLSERQRASNDRTSWRPSATGTLSPRPLPQPRNYVNLWPAPSGRAAARPQRSWTFRDLVTILAWAALAQPQRSSSETMILDAARRQRDSLKILQGNFRGYFGLPRYSRSFVLSLVYLFICLWSIPAFAGTVTADCKALRPLGNASIGSQVRINIPPRNFDMEQWWRENCEYTPYQIFINGEINSDLESSIRTVVGFYVYRFREQISRHEIGGWFIVDSIGGDVEAALRIGRMLRSVNASVAIPMRGRCYSSCVFLIVGAVERMSLGQVGIHRPYFGAVGRNVPAAEVRNRINAIDNLIERYLQDMNVPVSLLHAMKSVRPEDIQILSDHDLQRFMLNSPDPVWDELDVARQAWIYGTSSAEFRRRRSAVESRCFANVHVPSYSCIQAGYYAISVAEYQARTERKERICWSRHRNRTTPMSQREIQEARTCERDVMIGVRR